MAPQVYIAITAIVFAPGRFFFQGQMLLLLLLAHLDLLVQFSNDAFDDLSLGVGGALASV